jgi:hypothetical protein
MRPHPRGWAVMKEGGERATAITETRKVALEVARHAARVEKSELLIKDNDGKILARSFPHKSKAKPKVRTPSAEDLDPDFEKEIYGELAQTNRTRYLEAKAMALKEAKAKARLAKAKKQRRAKNKA